MEGREGEENRRDGRGHGSRKESQREKGKGEEKRRNQ